MAHLYELSTIFAHVQAEIEDSDPEAAQTALAKIDLLADAFEDKAKQVAFVIKNLQAMADAVGAESDRMAERKKAMDNRIAGIKEYLRSNMERAAVTKIECPQFKISLRDNPPKVNIIDEKAIPAEYIKTPEPPLPYPDKKKIIDDWKQGVVIDGVEITKGNRVEIK
jgi:Siphovirus Gp157